MGRRVLFVGFLLVLLGALAAAPAQARRYASMVIDADSGRILHAANPDRLVYPASLTKIMTIYMAFDHLRQGRLRPDQRLRVSRRAQGMAPSRLGLKAGGTITVEDAILSLVTKSANDAAVVLAEAMAKTEWDFALDMTRRARAMGMSRTTFRNASGLPDRRQRTTARDMATLGMRIIKDFPGYYHYFSRREFRFGKRKYKNHNNLLARYQGTDGIKTGYIRASGFNLVASVERGGRRVVAVVIGGRTSRSRDAHMVKLLDAAFKKLRSLPPIRLVQPSPRRAVIMLAKAGEGRAEAAGAIVGSAPVAQAATATAGQSAPLVVLRPRTVTSERGPKMIELRPGAIGLAALEPSPKRPDTVTGPHPSPPKPGGDYLARIIRPSGDHGVQVGAFSRRRQAEIAARLAALDIPGLEHTRILIAPIKGRRRTLYRARRIGLTVAEAQRACDRLERRGQGCLVVKLKPLQMAQLLGQ